MNKRKRKPQTGVASFSMHELAGLIVFEDDRSNALGRGEYFTKKAFKKRQEDIDKPKSK